MITKESGRRLDPEKVVDSALAIADDEGPAAVTFRRLAGQHEVTPMALYRHFKDKDDLLAALGDRLLADVVLPEPTDERWDKQLHKVLTAFVTALRGHPRLADLTLVRILASEPGLAMAERTMELLTEGGFSIDDAAEVGRQSERGDWANRDKPLITAAADTLICPSSTDRYYTLGIDLVVAGVCGVLNKE